MKLELLLGAMKNLETSRYGSPYKVIEDIRHAGENNVGVFICPEWSLTCPPGVFTEKMLNRKKPEKSIDLMFNAPDYVEYAPRDAKKILIDAIYNGLEEFNCIPDIPHSKKEHNKIVKDLLRESSKYDMVIYPGTDMFYDDKKVLYNHMPVIKKGKVISNIYKFRDGLGSRFNMAGNLKLYPSETMQKKGYSYPFDEYPIVDIYGLKTSAEICADAGILKELKINDLDLQVLSSCGNSMPVPAINRGGYIAIVDGFKKPQIKILDSYLQKVKPVKRSEEMDIFRLEFDD